MTRLLREIIAQNRAGKNVAIPSVCSAHPEVLVSSLKYANELGRPVVIEATSNQVNQFGGYTGMRAADFVGFVGGLVAEHGIDPDLVTFGGDHLGPQVWKSESADAAMQKAERLVQDYCQAGIRKIHLDCSEGCAGEPAQVDDQIAAERSARLAVACRDALGDPSDLVFVIGTEVPPPGGARMDESGNVVATTHESAAKTIAAHEAAFADHGISDLWGQVAGLVVQPGVEFTPDHIHHLPMDRDPGLYEAVAPYEGMCLEAHSTDYQHPAAYPRMAALGFAFQKVGPALTYAWRQALYGLDHLRSVADKSAPRLPRVIETAMAAEPQFWRNHYSNEDVALWHYGYADRVRYYWPNQTVAAAVADLLSQSDALDHPDCSYREVFSENAIARASRLGPSRSLALARAHVQEALAPYFFGAANGS